MAVNDLDAALEALKAAQAKFFERPDTNELAARIARLIAERDKKKEYSNLLDQAKGLVAHCAVRRRGRRKLEQLERSFPNEKEPADSLAYAGHELEAKKKSGDVKSITDAAADSKRAQRFDQAIRIVEEGLKQYPDSASLARLLHSTNLELQDFERDRALQAGLQRCENLQQRGRYQDALALVALLISDNPGRQDLRELDAKLKRERGQGERTAAIRKVAEQAEKLLQEGKPEPAVNLLEAEILNLEAEEELTPLLKKALEAQQTSRDRQQIEAELKHAVLRRAQGRRHQRTDHRRRALPCFQITGVAGRQGAFPA